MTATPQTYVVRIYTREQSEDACTGLVESVETGEAAPFRTAEELWVAMRQLPLPRRTSANPNPKENQP